jgi:hypothetical protein
MRRLSTLVAALATVFTVGSANALVILIDDFNSPDLVLADMTLGGGAASLGPTLPNDRTVTHELLAGTNVTGGNSKVTIGSTTFPAGTMEMANDNLRDSEVTVSWTLVNGQILDSSNGPASFLFQVVASDGNPTTAELFFNNVSIGNYVIPGNTFNLPLSFGVSAATQDLMNGGGNLRLAINGDTGWDMSIDSFGVTIPEPTSIALVGLALLGAGVASRRRQS